MSKLYTHTKLFHFTDKLGAIREGRPSAPIHIRLKPYNRCNHRCSYCCYRSPELYLSELMDEADSIPREKMAEIVADLGAMGVRAVTFSGGGEPLCYPYFTETVEGLLAAKVKVAVLTNGSLLRGEAAEVLGRGATWVRISMDAADGETYAAIREVGPKELDKVCANIGEFARIKSEGCELGINFIVTRENHTGLPAFLERMKGLGVDHVKISEAIVSTDPEENRLYTAPILSAVKARIAEATTALQDEGFAIIDKVHDFTQAANKYTKEYAVCPVIQCITVIAADMNVYACHDKAYTRSGLLGSIRDRSFRDLWFSDDLQERLRALDPSGECDHHCADHTKNLMLLEYLGADPLHLDFV